MSPAGRPATGRGSPGGPSSTIVGVSPTRGSALPAAVVRQTLADLRLGVRSLARSPALAVTVIVLLALGIGANTAVFSVMNAVLLRTLPVREPQRLVLFGLQRPAQAGGAMISQAEYRDLRDANSVLAGFAAVTYPAITLTGAGIAERANGLLVSGNFFETLGANAARGRLITPADEHAPVCVISYGLWQRRYGGDAGVIGRLIRVNGEPFTVIGITAKAFTGISVSWHVDISIPLAAPGMGAYANFPVQGIGRLRPGVSRAQAQASLDALYHRLAVSEARVALQPGSHGLTGLRTQYERPLLCLMAMAALVLLTSCANVVNLLLARASGRTKEIAVRLALGARRARLIRQLLAESAPLAMAGAAAGIGLAYGAARTLVALAPPAAGGAALPLDVRPDAGVLLFTLGVGLVTTVLCGLAPAIQSTRVDVAPALKGAEGLRAPGRFPLARGMVVAQVALSLVLLIGAGLFVRSLHNLRSVDPGLNPEHLVMLTLDPGSAGYSLGESSGFVERLVERARRIPGAASVSPGFISPLSGGFALTDFRVPGYTPRPGEPASMAVNWVGEDYFKVLGTPLVAGRVFTAQDGRANHVAIVNQAAERRYWPRGTALGRHALIGGADAFNCEIVGVVKDVKSDSLRQDAKPTVYLPFRQNRRAHVTLHVRTEGETATVISALLREIRALDPSLPVSDVATMATQIDRTMALDRLMATLSVLFGLLAVVVAAVGLYGVMTLAVAARTREIGIRMALGALPSQVLRQVIGESARLTLWGVAAGVTAALWASRFVASFLYGLSATDPPTYALLALGLAIVAVVAAWIPARRAAHVDPRAALRYE